LPDTTPDPGTTTAQDVNNLPIGPEQTRALHNLINSLPADASAEPGPAGTVLWAARHANLRRALIDIIAATGTAVPDETLVDRIHHRAVTALVADLA
jgi:hypothetical protein